ncbi:cell division protein ZapA, partial [Paenibacillus koleovorans]|uniref:cell division protein ZapA n=1 Tax=Paenibacillus koleovorans TaxID=121608 RepID=UPI000FD80395
MSNEEKIRVTVDIYGTSYKLVTNNSVGYVKRVAQYVNDQMHQIAAGTQRLDVPRIAVLAAVNMADETLQVKQEMENQVHQLEEAKQLKDAYVELELQGEAQKAKLERELERVRGEHERASARLREDSEQALARLKAEQAGLLERVRGEHTSEHERMRTEHERALAEARESSEQAAEQLLSEFTSEHERVRGEHERAL